MKLALHNNLLWGLHIFHLQKVQYDFPIGRPESLISIDFPLFRTFVLIDMRHKRSCASEAFKCNVVCTLSY